MPECLVLAGGLGTRLRSVVSDRPKSLASINGRPFLLYLLDRLVDANVERVVLCSGFGGEQLAATVGREHRGIEIVYSREPEPLGTAGAARLGIELTHSDRVLIANGDSYCDTDLRCLFGAGQPSLILAHVFDVSRYGRVTLDSRNRVRQFEEKGTRGGAGWINAGLYFVPREWILAIPPGRNVSLEREVLPSWVKRGLWAHLARGGFLDIGTPESYAAAPAFFADQQTAA